MIVGLDILLDGVYGAIAGIGFGAISHPPFRAFIGIAILSAVGHATRFFMMHYLHTDIATGSLMGAIAIGILSLYLGPKTRCPLTVIYIPSLLPMVPGKFAYNSIFALIKFLQCGGDPILKAKYMDAFFSNGVVAVAVVFFLAVGSTFPRFIFPEITCSATRNIKYRKKLHIK